MYVHKVQCNLKIIVLSFNTCVRQNMKTDSTKCGNAINIFYIVETKYTCLDTTKELPPSERVHPCGTTESLPIPANVMVDVRALISWL